jgi:hypothetical protein
MGFILPCGRRKLLPLGLGNSDVGKVPRVLSVRDSRARRPMWKISEKKDVGGISGGA